MLFMFVFVVAHCVGVNKCALFPLAPLHTHNTIYRITWDMRMAVGSTISMAVNTHSLTN